MILYLDFWSFSKNVYNFPKFLIYEIRQHAKLKKISSFFFAMKRSGLSEKSLKYICNTTKFNKTPRNNSFKKYLYQEWWFRKPFSWQFSCNFHLRVHPCGFLLLLEEVRKNIQVMSWIGDVVLDGFIMVYRDEENILDQTYEKQICSDFFMMNFIFHNIIRKFILTLE